MKRVAGLVATCVLVLLAGASASGAGELPLGNSDATGYILEVQTAWNRTLEIPIRSSGDLVAFVPVEGKLASAVKVVPKITAEGVEVEIFTVQGNLDDTPCANVDPSMLTPVGLVQLTSGDLEVVRSPFLRGAPPLQLRLREANALESLAGCDENDCRCPGHIDCCIPDPGKCCRPHGNCGQCCGPTEALADFGSMLNQL